MRLHFILLLCVIPILGFSQNILKGKITDEDNQPLSYASIVATPSDANKKLVFGISDEKGQYKLALQNEEIYEVAVRFLGYKPHVFQVELKENSIQNIQLFPDDNDLDEVIILAKPPPVTIKPDTIVFYVDSFMNGDERKLRDVLGKLPGVEVNEQGQVFVNGKQVKKLLVENKEFFGGNAGLAIKYIPADAVDKVEIFDGYSDVAFLDGDELAMNIQLKADKKRFVFGEIKAGTDANSRYLLHPNLFYYAPKLNINFIGDMNNADIPAFTFMNYFEFSGSFNQILEKKSLTTNADNDILKLFLLEQNIKNSREEFGAFNITYDINKNINSSGYFIVSNKLLQTQTQNFNQFILTDDLTIEENQTEQNEIHNLLGLGKLELKYKKNDTQYIKYQVFGKFAQSQQTTFLTSFSPLQSLILNNQSDNNSFNLNQELTWHQVFNERQIGSFIINDNRNQNEPWNNWQIDGVLFQNFIPILTDSIINIFQNKEIGKHQFQAFYQHKWLINNQNYLYFTGGYQIEKSKITTNEYQLLSNNTINDFSNSDGFGNDLIFNFQDIYLDINHRFKKGNFELKTTVGLHQIDWKNSQNTDLQTNKILLLPSIDAEKVVNNIGKFTFHYQLNSPFPDAMKFINQFTLMNYNAVFKGNPYLQNTLNHTVNFHFSRINLLKKTDGFISLNYTHNVSNIQNQTDFQGINQYSFPILLSIPQTQLRFRSRFKKSWKYFSLKPKLDGNRNLYYQNTNNETLEMQQFNINWGTDVATEFEDLPNIKLKYEQQHSFLFTNTQNTSTFITQKPAIIIKYKFLKNFLFTFESESTILKRENSLPIHFNLMDLSLSYQSKEKPFGFEIEVHNLLNVQQKAQAYFSTFLITESTTFIMPRVIMVSGIYTF